MCGIAGIYHFRDRKPVDRPVLGRMCRAIEHRGPDSEGMYFASTGRGPAAIAIRRLAVIDLATGDQPIRNEDGTLWLVLNGEIYNFRELRADLERRHRFYTKTDTEVIVHLYEEYGERCVEHLRGMFAFALWDEKNGRLFIARDRVGKKPLYYTVRDGTFVFASEVRAIVEYLGTAPDIDPEALDFYLTYQYIPSPKTIYRGIHSLPPASRLVCGRDGKLTTDTYWDIDFRKKTTLGFADAAHAVRELLTEATRLRMVADVPLGAFLSGGHDSSIVVGLMSELSAKPVKTFSIGFEDEEFSELPYARIVSRHFKTEHHEFVVRPDFIETLPGVIGHYGQPFADTSALPSYYVSHETRRHVTVALNGDGGDESFGGYLRYKAMKASLAASIPFRLLGTRLTGRLAALLPQVETSQGGSPFRYLNRLVRGLGAPPELRDVLWHSFFYREDKDRLYTPEFARTLGMDANEYSMKVFRQAPADNVMDRTFYTDIRTYLPECLLVKMDIASMANSLEARSPFLDHRLMEFSASLPPSWKVHGLTTKYILKKAFAGFLPEEIMRRKKVGFGIPVGKWFLEQKDWQDRYRDLVLAPQAVSRRFFRQEGLESLLAEHVSGRMDHGYRLWALLVLELWHRSLTTAR